MMVAMLVFIVAIAMVPLVVAGGILIAQSTAWVVTFAAAYKETE